MSARHILILVGLLLLAGGCTRPLDTAIAASNAAAASLRMVQVEMARRYHAEQLEAARRVQADRSSEAVRAEQRDRVEAVRRRWAEAWLAYEQAWSAWRRATEVLASMRRAEDLGEAPDLARIGVLLGDLVRAHQDLVLAARGVGVPP